MASIILESSYQTSSSSVSNAEWTSKFAEPFLIEPGDMVSMKNIFLDSGKNDPDDVIFETDTQVNMTFGYYVVDTDNIDKQAYDPGGAPAWPNKTYDTFIPYTVDVGPAIYGDIQRLYFRNLARPTGPYPWLGDVANFEYIDINGILQKWNFELDYNFNIEGATGLFYWNINPNKIGVLVSSFKMLNTLDEMNFNNAQTGPLYPKGGAVATLFTGDIQFTIPKGSYNSVNLAKYITDKMNNRGQLVDGNAFVSGNQFLRRTDERQLLFARVSTDNVVYNPTVPDVNNFWLYQAGEVYQIGSSQNSLQYNLDAQRNIFSLNYLHTPYQDDEGNNVLLDAIDHAGGFWTVNQASGVFLLSVSPSNLWENILGFDLTKLLVNPSVVGNTSIIRRSMLQLGQTITGEYAGLQSMLRFPTPADPFTMKLYPPTNAHGAPQVIPTLSSNTYSIDANDLNSNGSSGYYLIEISGLKQKYIYDDQVKFGINGIVSKQYNASSLIVGFDDSAVPFVNNTNIPILLNSVTVRILDPLTKLPADDLGDNNTLLLQIFKNGDTSLIEKRKNKK